MKSMRIWTHTVLIYTVFNNIVTNNQWVWVYWKFSIFTSSYLVKLMSLDLLSATSCNPDRCIFKVCQQKMSACKLDKTQLLGTLFIQYLIAIMSYYWIVQLSFSWRKKRKSANLLPYINLLSQTSSIPGSCYTFMFQWSI